MSPGDKPPQNCTPTSRNRAKRSPSWRELAQATADEQDPAELVRRAQELIRALDSESDMLNEQVHDRRNEKAAS